MTNEDSHKEGRDYEEDDLSVPAGPFRVAFGFSSNDSRHPCCSIEKQFLEGVFRFDSVNRL